MANAFPLVKIGGSNVQYNFTMIAAPSGWQPWDIAAHYQVNFWDQETIGGAAALVANVIDSATTPNVWTRVWMPLANVSSSG